ncbi:unnamed protein product, partial [Mesorhabditis belari]|uniref:Protein kinase domain-containing protein n=1 Tax=Mesorhabditis belari TaxID=2138241 RepID=A0AAF3FLZ4_9BILA
MDEEGPSGEYSQHYDALEELGQGSFGFVRLSRRKFDGKETVTKFLRKSLIPCDGWIRSSTRGKMVPIEVEVMETVRHPNITHLIDAFESPYWYSLVMEYRQNSMDLYEFLELRPKLDDGLICHIFRQVLAATCHLHSLGFLHRDIKDENVVIDSSFHCELIDFGSVAQFDGSVVFDSLQGTLLYSPPEVIEGLSFNGPEVESWQLGILLYTLSTFDIPFHSTEEIKSKEIVLPDRISDGARQLITWLLEKDPEQRVSVEVAAKHWWLLQNVQKYSWNDVIGALSNGTCSNDVIDIENNLLYMAFGEMEVASSI